MRHLLLALVATALSTGAQAQGFVAYDLTEVAPAMTDALGAGFVVRAESQQLTFACTACDGEPVIRLALSQQTDGTEQRVRSGTTKIADLDRICRESNATCRISALDVAPAVGWVSSYEAGGTFGATAILLRDGDMLTIRSIAKDGASAQRGVDALLPLVRARVVGN